MVRADATRQSNWLKRAIEAFEQARTGEREPRW
jgi:hypothetical protein